ncbi:unnamed protein product [Zymoseptoria tritici ST99CH_3D1]|uniref:Uncharacterized protein n=2 Tax=Zymoseptoria tritici TaxID=1047171 RepID=A0A1X7RPC3_ZYMT9|nr:unnamed protein product [Zymoseptoria tritici ST99CH_3D7]SMR49086.1 unnamed protein product [Zymoseptoria tritici ST99CH_1E4]SMR50263.1 unnamed protein product [Zymoseptoria tritici ST99CH_3D1]
MSSQQGQIRRFSRGPLDTHFHIALVRLSRAIIEEIGRLTEETETQLRQTRNYSTGILQSGLPAFHMNEAADVTACRAYQLSLMEDIRRSYFALGSKINGVFDDPGDAVGELGDSFAALIGVYIELAVEIFGLQENLAEHSDVTDEDALA